jgi:hypothetical protein
MLIDMPCTVAIVSIVTAIACCYNSFSAAVDARL